MTGARRKPVPEGVHAKPGLRVKYFIREDMIGAGKIELLRQIAETGSISAAARTMGMGYRRAWFLLDSLQSCFDGPLVVTERGGKASGGARLTPLGQELITRHATMQAQVSGTAADFLAWLGQRQRRD